jgi:hypothetical protein
MRPLQRRTPLTRDPYSWIPNNPAPLIPCTPAGDTRTPLKDRWCGWPGNARRWSRAEPGAMSDRSGNDAAEQRRPLRLAQTPVRL